MFSLIFQYPLFFSAITGRKDTMGEEKSGGSDALLESVEERRERSEEPTAFMALAGAFIN
jgi:hypothetical protein